MSKNGKWIENKGTVLLFDVKNNNVRWTRKIFYPYQSLQQSGKMMILSNLTKSYRLDIDNGQELWKIKDNIYYVDTADNVGFGKKTKGGSGISSRLEGINLKNGSVTWKRNLNRLLDWNNIFYINDTTLVLVAKGLHLIYVKTGSGWDYNAISGKKEKTGKGKFLSGALNVAVGVFTMGASFAMPVDMGGITVKSTFSNIIFDSTNIYFASQERLAKLNRSNGKVIWEHPFRQNQASKSKSTIFYKDSLVYMVNYGYYMQGLHQVISGKPFIAAYDKESGKQKYMNIMKGDDNPIHDFYIKDSVIYLVFNHKITAYSIYSGKLISKKEFSEKTYGKLAYFVGNQICIMNSKSNFVSLTKTDSTKLFVFTEKEIVELDNHLNLAELYDYKNVSWSYLKSGNYRFIMKNGQTWVINKKGQEVAELDVNSRAFLMGNWLYDAKKNSLFVIDLSKLIGKTNSPPTGN